MLPQCSGQKIGLYVGNGRHCKDVIAIVENVEPMKKPARIDIVVVPAAHGKHEVEMSRTDALDKNVEFRRSARFQCQANVAAV